MPLFVWQQVPNIWTCVRSNSLSLRRFLDLIVTLFTFEEVCSITYLIPKKKKRNVLCVSLSTGSFQTAECIETRVTERIKMHFSSQHNTLCLLRMKLAVPVLTWTSSGTDNKVTEASHPHMSEVYVLSIRPQLSVGIRYIDLWADQRADCQLANYVTVEIDQCSNLMKNVQWFFAELH